MEDPTVQIKTLIHHILHRHNIYKMDMEQLQQVLHLLGEEPAERPMDIQQKIFKGIVRFNQHYRDHVSLALSSREFQDVSFEIKSLMHKILHQYYFLNAIKAWEMFVPHFQQPGLHSHPNSHNSHGQLLDDQYEKARLHYQYYGPMSIYHLGQQLPPLPPQAQVQQPLPQYGHFQQPFQYLQQQKRLEFQIPRPPRGRPPLNRVKAPDLSPSKLKARQQAMSLLPSKRKIGQQQGDSVLEPSMRAFPEKMQSEQQEQSSSRQQNFQGCFCKGYLKNAKILKCKCQRSFHPDCHGSGKKCLVCKQAEYDPFNQVVWQLGTFLIDWDQKDSFEGHLNMLSHSNIFSTMQYGVMVSCAHPQYPGLCWPDDILFKINDQPVFEVPALLEAHSSKQRKDRQIIITPYLAALQSNPIALGRLKFNIEVINSQNSSSLPKRNNRKGIFQLCFFIVKRITPDEILSRVIDEYSKRQRVGPFDWNFYEVEPDRLSISVLDPYTCELIECPARGINCKHLQCFDLNTFLTMTYETNQREWKCPFCGGDVTQLLIDKYQLFLLKELKPGEPLPKKITFFQDGRIVFDKIDQQEYAESSKSKE